MGLVLTTAPASDPVSLAEAKEFLRIDTGDTSQDNILDMLIKSSARKVQEYLRRSLISQTWTWNLDSDDAANPIYLPRPTVTSITSVTTYDADGNTTVVASTNYELVEGIKLVARNNGWDINRKERAMTIVYVAGSYTDSTDVPADIKHAILLLVSTGYELRSDLSLGTIAPEIERGSCWLLDDYKYYGP